MQLAVIKKWVMFTALIIIAAGVLVYARWDEKPTIEQYTNIAREVKIQPDYSGIVVPPNIAPLNFSVLEDGQGYFVKIYSKQGDPIEVFSKTPKIIIPNRLWRELLNNNRGRDLYYDIFVQNNNSQWRLFSTVRNKIAHENIDEYLVYRKMHPTHTQSAGLMGIFQRNLTTFKEKVVIDNTVDKISCLNCHTFPRGNPDKMLFGARPSSRNENTPPATLLINDGKTSLIDTKFGYTSWHPSGRLAVYSINKLPMHFHLDSNRNEVRNTVNIDSAMAYYLVDDSTIRTAPQLSQKDILENWPAWSGDGRFLYFCSTKKIWSVGMMHSKWDGKKIPPKEYKQVKYGLMRISYDIENDIWGQQETVLSAQDTGGLSIAMPHPSPDGRWILFCMCDYGYFPSWQENSDLYMIDLKKAEKTGKYEYRRLEINSDQSEAWQSWSTNSRWIVFSSKRDYGPFTKPYISYIDTSGRASKPVLLPQKNPDFYNGCLLAYTTPEYTTGPIKHVKGELAQTYRGRDRIKVDVPITMATPTTDATDGQQLLWEENE